ncbi:MAG: chemotaxis-specific protein-glutamate methyltransferase CheB [Lachnospiraceae bacterium]|nr:chemotaxis-specific protein-glutamate methyltransferase CheB [Lachnospiraceae bacterium]
MYKILVADDSALVRKVICDIINANPDYQVTDTCMDGESAYDKAKTGNFDLIVCEMNIPKMNAMEMINKLETSKINIPVVVMTTSLKEDADKAFLAAGKSSVEIVKKPFRLFSAERADLEKQVILAISRFLKKTTPKTDASKPGVDQKSRAAMPTGGGKPFTGRKRLVAIASSTGGPQALHAMIPMLPKIGVPVVIVQHMPKGFTASLAERIDSTANLTVKEAENGEMLKADTVYIAPGGRHLEIIEVTSGKYTCRVFDDPPVNNLRPCADVMYRSLIKCSFEEIVCVVLTGMGADGSDGIEALKQNGTQKIYTITQSAETCVVYGMPKAAFQRGLSDEVRPLNEVANAIAKKLGV